MIDDKKKDVLIIAAIALVLLLIGVTYAYFTAEITGRETTSTVIVTGGEMSIHYDNLSNEILVENIYPREEAWVTKNFTVTGTNTTDLEMKYKVGLEVLSNSFEEDYLVYSLENTRSDSGTPLRNRREVGIPESGTTWFGNGEFVTGRNQVHAYTLRIYFLDTEANQNDAQNMTFTGKVVIEDVQPPVNECYIYDNDFSSDKNVIVTSYDIVYDGCMDYISGWNYTNEQEEAFCRGEALDLQNGGVGKFDYEIETVSDARSLVERGVIENVVYNTIKSYKINYNECMDVFVNDWGNTNEYANTICTGGVSNNWSIDADIKDGGATYLASSGIIDNIEYGGVPLLNLTQGFEYVNGQYTYRFNQTYWIGEAHEKDWVNVNSYYPEYEDGWGVVLTDVYTNDGNSTDPVTSKLCTSINGKPIRWMANLFNGSNASSIDLSSFDTSNVTDMNYMFGNNSATSLDLSTFDTSSVRGMSYMFFNSNATYLDLSSFDTSNVNATNNMFEHSYASRIDGLDVFNTSNVTVMGSMFNSSKVKRLDLRSFDTSYITFFGSMFAHLELDSLDLSSFDTSHATDMMFMFSNTKINKLDLSSFDMSSVTRTDKMFEDSIINTGYARTQADADKLNASSDKPTGLTFVVKP